MKVLPVISEMAPKAHEFMFEWIKFMNFLKGKLDRIDERTESTDNKVSYLIAREEPHARPDIYMEILELAAADPRNAIKDHIPEVDGAIQ